MEKQLEDLTNFVPSSLESRNERNVLMIIEVERRIHLYIKQLIQISEFIYQFLIIM
jgi:hypothetical protein